MNSNWTGRTARTLSECHFRYDCEAVEHYKSGDRWAAWIPVWVIVVLAILGAVHLAASL